MNEVIPLTGTFFSGVTEFYTKTYINITSGSALSGGFWQTVYDGAPTSISSSALIDLTYGHSSGSLLAGYSQTFINNEKQRIYKLMAQRLLGNKDSLFSFNSTNYHELFFLSFKRRIFKDEIKKGNLTIDLQVSGTVAGDTLTLTDAGAATTYTVGSAGDEASLYSGSTEIGKVYYNAGVVAFMTGVLLPVGATNTMHWSGAAEFNSTSISGNIDNIIFGLKNHINNIQFQNQTNLNSTLYFCRLLNSEFNYSSNPTFVDSDGRILPTSGSDNQTRTYATSVNLMDINNQILAVAKTSEPIKKSPDTEVVFRVRTAW